MSISAFQEKFLNKSCGTILVVFFGLVFLGFGFTNCSRFNNGNQATQEAAADQGIVATVGGVPIPEAQVEAMVTQETERYKVTGALPLPMVASLTAAALQGALRQASYVKIAEDLGFTNDDAILQGVDSLIKQKIELTKEQMIQQKKLPANPTPKQMDDAFKPMTQGKTIAEVLKANQDGLKQALSDKSKRPQVLQTIADKLVLGKLASQLHPTDDELKASYQSLVVKQIVLSKSSGPSEAPDARAKSVLAALKSGMSFEAAMDKYSNEAAQPKKKVSDNEIDVNPAMLESDPSLKGLKGKPVGFISDPIAAPDGSVVIQKIVSTKSSLPKDFAKKSAKYRQDYIDSQSQTKLQTMVRDLLKSGQVKWMSKGYQSLYELADATSDPSGDLQTRLAKVEADAREAIKSGKASDIHPAGFALYAASNGLYNNPAGDKAKMMDDRIDALSTVLRSTEDYDVRMELADLYAKKKDGADAILQLTSAAHANTEFDATGQKRFGDLAGKAVQYKNDGLVTEAQLKDFYAEQANWTKNRASYEQSQSDMKKQKAILDAQDAITRKKNEEELKKQQDEAKKSGKAMPTSSGSSSGGGSVLPPGTGAGNP